MLPFSYYMNSNVLRPVRLLGALSTFGVLGSTITASAGISDFTSTGNRCCSFMDVLYCTNSVGDMYRMTSVSVSTKVLVKCSSRPVQLRNAGCTMNKGYVYVVNGIQPVVLGSTSNVFHRYNTVLNTWETLAVSPYSTSTSEIAINYDLNDYVYYTNSTGFYRYNISTNTWSSISTGHGLTLGVHSLVYYQGKLYLASGNVLKSYDIQTGVWSTLASMPLLSTAVRMFRYRGYLYCFGGLTGVLQYNIKSNTWITVQSTLLSLGDMCAGVVGSSGYIFSGSTVYGLK